MANGRRADAAHTDKKIGTHLIECACREKLTANHRLSTKRLTKAVMQEEFLKLDLYSIFNR
jgi:hypothetical protein